ncbi:anti-sigma factor [Winogradskyella sp. A3E31]|uniref:anti-sigma factor n=1 Tax=Winogradskyella sp. A3E31 TaxID=3349637 RepID=UPI00398BA434
MEKKKIIEEGWLEQYAIGTLTANDKVLLDRMLQEDTELRHQLDEIELNLEKISLENTIEVPQYVKSGLFKNIKKETGITSEISVNQNSRMPIMIAASIAAILMFGCFYLYSEMNGIKEDLQIVRQENSKLKQDLNTTKEVLTETNNWFGLITDKNTERYTLRGNALAPDAKLTSYVNHETKSVALHTHNLPELDEEHDYQMWADVDGEMINMGVIPKNANLMAMTYIDNAESLNITIEPAGGNTHPTVERLISNVYLN